MNNVLPPVSAQTCVLETLGVKEHKNKSLFIGPLLAGQLQNLSICVVPHLLPFALCNLASSSFLCSIMIEIPQVFPVLSDFEAIFVFVDDSLCFAASTCFP